MLALVACVALMLGLAVTPPAALAAPAVASAPAVQDSARLPDKHAIALDTWNWIPASGWIKCNYLSAITPKWTNFRIEIQHNTANTSRRIDLDPVGRRGRRRLRQRPRARQQRRRRLVLLPGRQRQSPAQDPTL
jgi:hypothetical protein